MKFSAIAAMSENRVIGVGGRLPWHLPEDFKFFKNKTSGHMMIMGRKTFDSLPGLLPNRHHVVITRQRDFHPPGAVVFNTITDAIEHCRSQTDKWGNEIFIIGGGQLFEQMMELTDRIYLTVIHKEFKGDSYFPEIDPEHFKVVERVDRSEPMPFTFFTYERIR